MHRQLREAKPHRSQRRLLVNMKGRRPLEHSHGIAGDVPHSSCPNLQKILLNMKPDQHMLAIQQPMEKEPFKSSERKNLLMSSMRGLLRENFPTRVKQKGCATVSITSRAKETAGSPLWVDTAAATGVRCWDNENNAEKDFTWKVGDTDSCPPSWEGWAAMERIATATQSTNPVS